MLARLIRAALVAAVLVVAAMPAGANELAATLSCDTATVHAVRYPPGLHLARALLTVEGTGTALPDRAWSGPEAVLSWDVSALTDRPGVLAVSLDVATDTGATLHAAASLRCQEPATTTTTVPTSTTTAEATTTTVPVTTSSVPPTAPQGPPEPPPVSPPPTLPRTGSGAVAAVAPWLGGVLLGAGLVFASAARRRA